MREDEGPEEHLQLRCYPDPVLAQRCGRVDDFDMLGRLLHPMAEVMQHHDGVGLAAPQVGIPLRFFIFALPGDAPELVANPEIVEEGGPVLLAEACLSVPGLSFEVPRPAKLVVSAQDVRGRSALYDLDGYRAQIFSHEVDHLDGRLLYERLHGAERRRAEKALRDGFGPPSKGEEPTGLRGASEREG